jgi:hypothetical protein
VDGGQIVVFVKQLFSGAQVVTAPLSVVNVTLTWLLGMPIPTEEIFWAIIPTDAAQVLPGCVHPLPFTATYRVASCTANARVW